MPMYSNRSFNNFCLYSINRSLTSLLLYMCFISKFVFYLYSFFSQLLCPRRELEHSFWGSFKNFEEKIYFMHTTSLCGLISLCEWTLSPSFCWIGTWTFFYRVWHVQCLIASNVKFNVMRQMPANAQKLQNTLHSNIAYRFFSLHIRLHSYCVILFNGNNRWNSRNIHLVDNWCAKIENKWI